MIIPQFHFEYTHHAMLSTNIGYVKVRFTDNSRLIDPNKEYTCKVLAGDYIYQVTGEKIINPFIYHIELLDEQHHQIPEKYSTQDIFHLFGVSIATT
ncbi:MAG: hypothetical protein WD512_14605 [Candidatus Paceibacterota bacterium]